MAAEFRILDDNYVLKSEVGLSATSSDANFPTTNLSSPFRSRVWRSSGYFELTASNNKMDFKDGGGTTRNIAFGVGNYTRAQLIIEIKNVMDTIGFDTYTVSYSESTNKWTISSDGPSFEILWSSGAQTGTSIGATLGFDVSVDDTGATTYTAADIALHTVERFVVDTKGGEPVDSFALLFPESGSKFTPSATITLKANHTANFSSPAVSQVITIDSDLDVATHFFSADQNYRYWAVEIVDVSNPYGYVEIGAVTLANSTQVQGPEIGFSWELEDLSDVEDTDFGQRYADLRPNQRTAKYTFKTLTLADRNTLEDIFNRIGGVIPIGISLDSTEVLYDKERFFLYGTLEQKASFKHIVRDFFDFGLTQEEKF